MNMVFMGTPEFSVPSLRGLIDEHNVSAIFTQPDRPKGRGKKLTASPVKELALEHSIKIFQPEKLRRDKECIEALKEINPDFIIVVAYGQILSKEILDIPKYGCLNLHASLLPTYRGAAPINFAIINGEKVSGNTTMLMDVGLDTGDMLLKSEYRIDENMTAGQLHDILMKDGKDLLLNTIKGIVNGEIKGVKQKDEDSIYAHMLNKKMGEVNWKLESSKIHNLIRGLNPWPVAYTHYNNQIMKIYDSEILNETTNKEPGCILEVSKEGIKVASINGVILIKKIQFPSKKPMYVEEYIKGHDIQKGVVLV